VKNTQERLRGVFDSEGLAEVDHTDSEFRESRDFSTERRQKSGSSHPRGRGTERVLRGKGEGDILTQPKIRAIPSPVTKEVRGRTIKDL